MLKKKQYKILNIVKLLFTISPIKFSFILANKIIDALIPAFQVIVIGVFVDTSLQIFNQKLPIASIFTPAYLLFFSIVYTNLMPVIINLINTKYKQNVEVVIKNQLIIKQVSLEYEHIENKDTLDLIERIRKNALESIYSVFMMFLNMLGITIHVVSVLLIIMKSSIIIGCMILIISIPLLYKAVSLGEKVYEMNIDSSQIKRRYLYLEKVLVSRETAAERNLFHFSKYLSRRYNDVYDEAYQLESEVLVKTFINLKSGSIVSLFLSFLIISFLLVSVYSHTISIGIFIALTNAIFNLVQTMSWDLSSVIMEYAKSNEFLKDFSKLMNLSEKQDAVDIPKKDEQFIFETLEFRNVSFTYPRTETKVLNNCSFILKANQSYGFVGANGAGKTTIVKLITGMYDTYTGMILINGIDLKEYSFAELKGIVAVVFQDFAQYATTIKENIMNGNPNLKDLERFNDVIHQTGLDILCESLPDGIDTYLGKVKTNSYDVSVGQWQRLAIARLLYANALVNILDEPTASLDPIEESRVYQLLEKTKSKRFSIYITHRLGIVKSLDTIFVLGDGTIKESGSHDALLHMQGLYYEMYESQKQWYKEGDE